ncbi:MAG: PAS domain-containing sensor histidine kinase [Candidatus Saccharibacteria bacterium]
MTNTQSSLTLDDSELVFESIGEGAIVVGTTGQVVKANKVALDILGYNKSELIGQRFSSKVKVLNIDHKKISSSNQPLLKAITTGKPVYEYLYYQGKKPELIPVFVSAAPIIKASKAVGASEIFRDISVEEAVDQMKSEFISLASHQLRTPLASIKTYSHMLLEGYMGEIDNEKRSALETIVASTNRMNELISTLLNITRLESGGLVIEPRPVDIVQIVSEVMDEMAILAKSRSVNLRSAIRGKASTKIWSDRPIIKEVVANLVSNSIKYSRDNGDVTITTQTTDKDVTISVKDSGFGIPEHAKSQIFTKFFRAHNVIQLETNGTGLGLYLVKGLVDQLGGRITFTSKEGQGTTFRLKLPRKITARK